MPTDPRLFPQPHTVPFPLSTAPLILLSPNLSASRPAPLENQPRLLFPTSSSLHLLRPEPQPPPLSLSFSIFCNHPLPHRPIASATSHLSISISISIISRLDLPCPPHLSPQLFPPEPAANSPSSRPGRHHLSPQTCHLRKERRTNQKEENRSKNKSKEKLKSAVFVFF
ncbi:hypothetical protein Peur_033062 [Populus x canadensis]